MTETERCRSLLTTDEASALLRCKRGTLERWRCSGGGPPYLKAGPGERSRVFYARGDFEKWMRNQTFFNTSQYVRRTARPGRESSKLLDSKRRRIGPAHT